MSTSSFTAKGAVTKSSKKATRVSQPSSIAVAAFTAQLKVAVEGEAAIDASIAVTVLPQIDPAAALSEDDDIAISPGGSEASDCETELSVSKKHSSAVDPTGIGAAAATTSSARHDHRLESGSDSGSDLDSVDSSEDSHGSSVEVSAGGSVQSGEER